MKKPAVRLSHSIRMFSLQHFFSYLAPLLKKMKIHKFLQIMSAVNLSPFLALKSVFTHIPQYCTTAAAAAVALSNGLYLLQNPAGAAVASAALHTAKRSLGAIRTPTHAASANTVQAGVLYFSCSSDPTDLKTPVWDGAHSLMRLLHDCMFRSGVELQICQVWFLFLFLFCFVFWRMSQNGSEKKKLWYFNPSRCHMMKTKREADSVTCISVIDTAGNVKSKRSPTRVCSAAAITAAHLALHVPCAEQMNSSGRKKQQNIKIMPQKKKSANGYWRRLLILISITTLVCRGGLSRMRTEILEVNCFPPHPIGFLTQALCIAMATPSTRPPFSTKCTHYGQSQGKSYQWQTHCGLLVNNSVIN